MTLGTFCSVSLDPPIIGFFPRVSSKTWAEIADATDKVCVNILGDKQEDVCRAVATRGDDKFQGISIRRSPMGNPVIEGALGYIDSEIIESRQAGDHLIVLARVLGLDSVAQQGNPLLFFRGGYGSFTTRSLAAGGEGLLHELATADVARPYIEGLASNFDTEVDTLHLVGDEFVVTTSSGVAKTRVTPMRVGSRYPFAPPLGAVFAAWGDDSMRERWMNAAQLESSQREWLVELLDAIRSRGFNVTLGHDVGEQLEVYTFEAFGNAKGEHETDAVLRLMREAAGDFAPIGLKDSEVYEFRSATAPVFDAGGNVVFALTIWGPPGELSGHEVAQYTSALCRAAARTTEALGHL